jgi:hypothetical protein
MIKKPSIPVYSSADKTLTLAITAIKENIEIMNGSRPGTSQMNQLSTTASNTEIISKINEIIAALNFSGK